MDAIFRGGWGLELSLQKWGISRGNSPPYPPLKIASISKSGSVATLTTRPFVGMGDILVCPLIKLGRC